METIKNYLKALFNGNISLAIVFWFWFIFISLLIEYFFNYKNNSVNFTIQVVLLLYSISIFFIIFRSANKYQGNKFWSFLAKTIISINLFISLSYFIEVYKYNFLEDYYIEKEIKSLKNNLPIQVDTNSTLVDIYKKEKTIFYKYSLNDVDLSSKKNQNILKRKVHESICEDYNTTDLLKKDYILTYEYINQKEEKIIDIKTTKENCPKSIYDLEILAEVLKQQEML
jgi:hypothetical protein